MITELFDESLELMRRMLCWSREDVDYKPLLKLKKKSTYLSTSGRKKLASWLKGDYYIYNHFVKILQEKIKNVHHIALKRLKIHREKTITTCQNLLKGSKHKCKMARFRKFVTKRTVCPCQPFLLRESCESMELAGDFAAIAVCAQKDIYNKSYYEHMMYDLDCEKKYGRELPVYY